MPRQIVYITLVLVALSWIPLSLIARARVSDSRKPRLQVIADMDDQPKFAAQAANLLFADGRAMRTHVTGTVAADEPVDDDHLLFGRQNDDWATASPLPLTAARMQRGQQRFAVFCSPCHGLGGAGDGMVSRRADRLAEGTWIPPTDLTGPVVSDRPDGHIFNTIKHGIRNMAAYGSQIPPEDRWAIVAYIRALQRSRSASIEDVPAEARTALE